MVERVTGLGGETTAGLSAMKPRRSSLLCFFLFSFLNHEHGYHARGRYLFITEIAAISIHDLPYMISLSPHRLSGS